MGGYGSRFYQQPSWPVMTVEEDSQDIRPTGWRRQDLSVTKFLV